MSDIRGLFNVVREGDGQPGMRLLFFCPGCGFVHGPSVGEGPGPRWTWNGDYERPVFSPSLLVRWRMYSAESRAANDAFRAQHGRLPTDEEVPPKWDEKVCHSFIGCNGAQPGQIVFLGDCTHALAGQVVDIPPFSWET